jgi:hypothetical protein
MAEYQLPKAYAKKRAKHAGVLRFQRYERLKAQWIEEHPDSTPDQYTAAMVAIAKRCGV